ncbi:MAG: hypothetical protein NTV42_09195 [Chloroflexi bacterium]|nr:hypothetical protein [Chloroflexota bacterium]
MKTRFPSILGVFAAILMVASFVVPMHLTAPAAVSADPGIMKWDTVSTPMSVSGKNDILNEKDWTGSGFNSGRGSSIQAMANGNDGMTIVFLDDTFIDQISAGVVAAVAPSTSTVSNGLAAPNAVWTAIAAATPPGAYGTGLYYSSNSGISATVTRYLALVRSPNFPGGANLYQVAIAPDDAKVWAVTSDRGSTVAAPTTKDTAGPTLIWYTTDAGQNWDLAFDGFAGGLVANNETIRCIDISADYGGKRDIGFGTAATNGGHFYIRSSSGFTTWQQQDTATAPITGLKDFVALKFSPTYSGDSSVALVYTTDGAANLTVPGKGTFFNVAFRDLALNTSGNYAYMDPGIKVWNSTSTLAGGSPPLSALNNASLQLPSDFSGQSASLRRAYISLDANAGYTTTKTYQDGIYRIDDTTVYVLMDTTQNSDKSIYTIAYFGTYASGKLLAGERFGYPCLATVPTWFTDSPTTCPIPCWYPALKPTTGAANMTCTATTGKAGTGAALVAWNADGSLGYAATGRVATSNMGGQYTWFTPWIATPVGNDESAFALSRNNGETWNQIVLINTTIDWFNDVAVAPDCTTIYLASANHTNGTTNCNSFDSVWRSTINPNVAAPLPAVPPLGVYWERVYTRVTAANCGLPQTDLPILRVVPSCTDKKDGEIVGWAAQGAAVSGNLNGVMAWSPDYGDYWATITPRFAVQDFAFESSTSLYTVNGSGMVQRMPYTGTSWSTNLPTYQSNVETAHTIVAIPDGKVLVGSGYLSSYPVSYSADKGVTFDTGSQSLQNHGQMHVFFDVDFKNNNFIYAGDDGWSAGSAPAAGVVFPGSVYRNTVPGIQRWTDNDMMGAANGNGYIFASAAPALAWPAGDNPPHIVGQYGVVQAWTGDPQPALYSAHAPVYTSVPPTATVVAVPATITSSTVTSITGSVGGSASLANNVTQLTSVTTAPAGTTTVMVSPLNSAVCRTLKPRDGMPKPGIAWDCLDIFAPITTTGVKFTLEPTSLKYCGCCTLDTNTTLYAIDNRAGGSMYNYQACPYSAYYGTGYYAPTLGYAPCANLGMLWAYTDCLAKKGPVLKSPADQFLIGADPVSGRNQQIDLSWEQLCLTTVYQLQVAKDAAFTLRINPAVNTDKSITAVVGSLLLTMDATNMTSPAAWIAPGALPEAGAIYYWRIRSAQSATKQIAASPWSAVRSFTVKAGFIVNTPYYGVQLLAPNNGCIGCKVKPASFSWSPWKEATKYQFDLAKDPEFKTLVVTATTTTTGYEYSGTLDYSTNYFWRVKALEVNGQNIPSDWSATFSMQTEPAPAPPAAPPAEPATPIWVWVIIAIGAILVIVTLILIFKTRRV